MADDDTNAVAAPAKRQNGVNAEDKAAGNEDKAKGQVREALENRTITMPNVASTVAPKWQVAEVAVPEARRRYPAEFAALKSADWNNAGNATLVVDQRSGRLGATLFDNDSNGYSLYLAEREPPRFEVGNDGLVVKDANEGENKIPLRKAPGGDNIALFTKGGKDKSGFDLSTHTADEKLSLHIDSGAADVVLGRDTKNSEVVIRSADPIGNSTVTVPANLAADAIVPTDRGYGEEARRDIELSKDNKIILLPPENALNQYRVALAVSDPSGRADPQRLQLYDKGSIRPNLAQGVRSAAQAVNEAAGRAGIGGQGRGR